MRLHERAAFQHVYLRDNYFTRDAESLAPGSSPPSALVTATRV